MYPRTIIDSLPAVPNRDQLTHKDLHAHFSTGQSILLSGSGRDKKYGYRNGIQTDLGDIRNDVWRDLVRELIVRSHEEDLFDKLLEWEKEHTYWLKTKAELEHYTLELYAARIFDNPKWVDYEAFAKHYGYQPQSYEGVNNSMHRIYMKTAMPHCGTAVFLLPFFSSRSIDYANKEWKSICTSNGE